MKFYVHHIGGPGEALTMVFEPRSSDLTVSDVKQICEKEVAARCRKTQSISGEILFRKKSLDDLARVEDILEDLQELTFVTKSCATDDAKQTKSAAVLKTDTESNSGKALKKPKQDKSVSAILKEGSKLESKGQSYQAVEVYTRWLETHTHPDVSSQLASIYMKVERYKKALDIVKKALEKHPNCQSLKLSYASCLLHYDAKEALAAIVQYSKELREVGSASTQVKHQLQMLMCHCYQKLDKRDMAIVLVQGVLRETPEHEEARLELAQLTYGLSEEHSVQILSLLISALVNDRENQKIQKYLTEVAQKPKAMELLEKVCGEAWKDVPALVLLATVFRNHGALDLCKETLKQAMKMEPSNPDAILAYIHLLEIENSPDAVVEVVRGFCSSSCRSGVFSRTAVHVGRVLAAIPGSVIYSDCTIVLDTVPSPALPPYNNSDLTVLAIWYTVVRVLCVQGALPVLSPLIQILAPYHNEKLFSGTEIRNEAAFFTCIQKMCSLWDLTPTPTVQTDYIYILGDSHCIPPAWSSLQYQGREVMIRPLLCTGVKIWHLRDESTFYTKTLFHNLLKSPPEGSTLLMLLGEIDCREAIIRGVHSCKYDTMEESIESTVALYVEVLCKLVKTYKLQIHVHPIPPVLQPTRPIVTKFNEKLEVSLQKKAKLTYMTTVAQGLTEGDHIKQQYGLDGTHLHPAYVSLIEKSFTV